MTPHLQTTRLAPSPTGDLHLGNARSLLLCWALGRSLGWQVILRIEDLDGTRCDPRWESLILEGLHWLGIDWDGPVLRQSDEPEKYEQAMKALDAGNLIFTCPRSRREVRAAAEAAGAPHQGGRKTISTPAMRPDDRSRFTFAPGDCNHRLVMEPGKETVQDECVGRHAFELATQFGDPIVWTRENTPSYQLAVVADDLQQGITDVVRAADLLPSAGLQQKIAERLQGSSPRWWHLPLLLDHDGRRLAKRDGDHTLSACRLRGVSPERVIGLLARTCEIQEDDRPMSLERFLRAFDADRMCEWAGRIGVDGETRLRADDITRLMELP